MANYQPNYIYSPLYGNRYMGGSRTPAPSTGGAGQVDTSSIQSRNTAVGVPYSPVVQEQQGPYGFSSTGRDQSAVESLGTFGFRDMSGLTMDPFEGTDYLTNGFGSPAPINTRYVESVPEPQVSAPVNFNSGGGDSNNYTPNYSYDNQSQFSYDSTPNNNDEMIAALANYGYGFKDTPDLVQALKPGAYLARGAANMMTWQKNEEELAALDKYNAVMDPVTGQPIDPNLEAVVNLDGTITYQYRNDGVFNQDNTKLSAEQFGSLQNSLPEGAEVQGVDAAGNVNVTMPDGTTARAGVSPNTGKVNTYNFNVNDTTTYSNSNQFQDYTDGDEIGQDAYGGSSTSNTAASENANVGSTPSAPQTNEELDADSTDSGTGGGKG